MPLPNTPNDLKTQHAELEARLKAEYHRGHPDEALIKELKRAKLRIKDQLTGGQHA